LDAADSFLAMSGILSFSYSIKIIILEGVDPCVARRGKDANMQYMRRDAELRSFLPRTRLFHVRSFHQMLGAYGSVIVKPRFGSGGVGVIKVTRLVGHKYAVRYGTRKRVVSGRRAVHALMKQIIQSKPYIVQRYIPLIHLRGRPVDFRVMVQRKTRSARWRVTAKLAKVAGANHVITNVARSKGYVLPAGKALRRWFSKRKSVNIMAGMNHIGLRAAMQLGRTYGWKTIGIDMAVDRKGKGWVLETNSKPNLSLFLKLRDKRLYRHILRNK
jgi:hypothetical protein